MLTCIRFPFLRMGIYTKIGRGPLFLPSGSVRIWHPRERSVTSLRLMSWTRLRTPPLGSVQQNTALYFVGSSPMCDSLSFLWDAHRAPCPLEYMVLIVDHVTALVMNCVMRGMHEIARASWRSFLSSS